ncbi:CHAT domain-containing protein [Pseudoalteromonas sp. XMcav11-Q]|uniref:CHAT domain-containing protein n=1 Tax=Pseudoalteromonas sp. XMcav11-Q TaxID=3136665 RepID=UPI0032C4751E
MVRHEVSRIPISPGNVSTSLLLNSEQIILNVDSFKKVRIISSFADDDPIKGDLKAAVDFLINQLTISKSDITSLLDGNDKTKGKEIDPKNQEELDISIEWNNVTTQEELMKSLRENDSAITIFDLHGGHSENGSGVIKLKDEFVSVYDLIGKVKISPIVILSSCDTSPIDRNHNSTANAFFLAGAKTVLASALPILSREASIFIARLLLRVKHYLPQRLKGDSGISIRWSSFVTGMIRRTFYSELLALLEKKSLIKNEDKMHLLFHVGLYLDPLDSDWHEKILTEISAKVGFSCVDLKNLIEKEFMMPECLKYIQLGNPESIIIATEEHIPLVAS